MNDKGMDLRFWGVRGGIPTPGAEYTRYGGNTSCLSLTTDQGDLLILDAGTGIRRLGNLLLLKHPDGGIDATILFSHLHWDHIQGIPFFKPLFDKRNRFTLMGQDSRDVAFKDSLQVQQSSNFFPVDLNYMSAEKLFRSLAEEELKIGNLTIRSRRLNHPGGCLGYRIEYAGNSIVYATDHEHVDTGADPVIVDLARDADLLIFDCNYTPEEYEEGRQGWGHSTWAHAITNAREANVGRLVLFHHDQDHSDEQMDRIVADAGQQCPSCVAACEDMVIRLRPERPPMVDRSLCVVGITR